MVHHLEQVLKLAAVLYRELSQCVHVQEVVEYLTTVAEAQGKAVHLDSTLIGDPLHMILVTLYLVHEYLGDPLPSTYDLPSIYDLGDPLPSTNLQAALTYEEQAIQ